MVCVLIERDVMAKIRIITFSLALFLTVLLNSQLFCSVWAAPELASTTAQSATASTIAANQNDNKHIVATTLETIFKADDSSIWSALIDFQKYPSIFKRIQSVEITKRNGNLVYVESHLKPHMFIKRIIQHMVNDLSAGPKVLTWSMLDGNFKYVNGKWEMQARSPNTCLVKYTLYIDPGPIIPAPLVNFIVHFVQQEIVAELKHYVEDEYRKKEALHRVAAR